MKEQISYDIFDKVDIRIGTVLSVKKNIKARKPSLVIEVDFGKEIGIKQSSAQITHFYNEENFLRKSVERVLKIKDIKTIYLINDGSKDNSLDIAKQLELENTSIKLLSSDINSGKGDALNLVREYIETSHVVIHDADLEYFPDDIQGMFELSQNNTDSPSQIKST